MKTKKITVLLATGGIYTVDGKLLPTITVKDEKGNDTEVPNRMIPIYNDNDEVAWGLLPVDGDTKHPVIKLYNRYKSINMYTLVNDADKIKKAITAINKNTAAAVASKRLNIQLSFTNVYKDNTGKVVRYMFNTDTYFPNPAKDNYVEQVQKNLRYLTYYDFWGGEKLVGVIHDVADNGIRQLTRALQFVQIGSTSTLDSVSTMSSNTEFKVNQYYNDINKDLRRLIAIASDLSNKHMEEEQRYDADDKKEDSVIYYREYLIVDYRQITIHLPEIFKYIVPNTIKNSKYLNTEFDNTDDAYVKARRYSAVFGDSKNIIDYKEKDFKINEIHEEIIDNVKVTGRWTYEGKYHMLKAGDLVLNPINKYNAPAAMPEAIKTYHIINNDYSWLSKYVSVDHDRYTDDEIRQILKYSVGDENTVNEINYTHSNAMNVIKNDLINLKKYGYKGECWYRLIRDTRPVSDTADDLDALADNGDLESKLRHILVDELKFNKDDIATMFFGRKYFNNGLMDECFEERVKLELKKYLEDHKTAKDMLLERTRVVPQDVVTFNNDIDGIIDTYQDNYREIGNQEYLIFEVK